MKNKLNPASLEVISPASPSASQGLARRALRAHNKVLNVFSISNEDRKY